MKVLVPVALDRGLDSRISPHFGRAPLHLVIDRDTGETRTYPNDRTRPGSGACRVILERLDHVPDVALVGGIGSGALERLRAAGVRVLHAGRGTVADALAALDDGSLRELDDDPTCGQGR